MISIPIFTPSAKCVNYVPVNLISDYESYFRLNFKDGFVGKWKQLVILYSLAGEKYKIL